MANSVFTHKFHRGSAGMFRIVVLPKTMAHWIRGGHERPEVFIQDPLVDIAGHYASENCHIRGSARENSSPDVNLNKIKSVQAEANNFTAMEEHIQHKEIYTVYRRQSSDRSTNE